jgi:hypothetical protein
MQVDPYFVVLRTSDFAVLSQIDAALEPELGRVSPRAFHAGRALLAWVTSQGDVRIWNIATPGEPHTLVCHRKVTELAQVAFSPDGSLLVVSDSTGLVTFDTRLESERWSAPQPVVKLARTYVPEEMPGLAGIPRFFPDGTMFEASWSSLGMSVFAADSGAKLYETFRPWTAWEATDSQDSVMVWSRGAPERIELRTRRRRPLTALAACDIRVQPASALGGSVLACSTEGARVRVVDVAKDKVVTELRLDNEPTYDPGYQSDPDISKHPYADDLCLTSDGLGILAGLQHTGSLPQQDPHTRLFSVPGGKVLDDLGRAIPLGRAADGRLFYVNLHTLELIVVDAGPSVHQLMLPATVGTQSGDASTMRHSARIAHDGRTIALADDQNGYLVDTNSGRVALLKSMPIEPIDSPVIATFFFEFSFAADDTRLFAITKPGQAAAVWELPSGRPVFVVQRRAHDRGAR